MYKLLLDGVDTTIKSNFESFNGALWWYDYALTLGACSVSLWCDKMLIKFQIRGEK